MSANTEPIELNVSHRGATYKLSLLPTDTLALLYARLEELTGVPPPLQKLLYKGKKLNTTPDDTLEQAGLRHGTKLQMLGTRPDELQGLQKTETEHQRRERILRERAARGPVKVRSTARSGPDPDAQFRFHRIEPLAHLPVPESARTLLQRLADDPAVRAVMRAHKLAVGLLTELAPHEQPHLLGLNVNAGEAIKLRLRTDRYDGFRTYKEVRRVLCHELTHNVWGDHDDNFKKMNSQLNREVLEFERAAAAGTHSLSEMSDTYAPSSELEAEAAAHVLGGGTNILGGQAPGPGESREEMRRRVLEATMQRLRKEEEELETRCGTGSATEP
ncbi:WLM-domain-containing protein [Obba rivulosa]|uniref:WLM-domain-containing protein n=1 Tax=Obba rivulosa TaxID=1052685 RepID=A0A8E2AJU4_9APHY|nr:WLM-domain-containing protein [Obba rivulosa]